MRLLIGALAAVAVILVWGMRVYRKYGEESLKAKWVIPLYMIAGVTIIVGFVTGYFWFSYRQYDSCISGVDRSEAQRLQSTKLYDTIDFAVGSDHYTTDELIPGTGSLRASLPKAIAPETCNHFKP